MARPPSRQPTPKQLEAFRALVAYVSEHGYQPSQEELARLLGVTKTAVADRLRGLARHGLVVLPTDGRERAVGLVGVTFTPKFEE